MQRRFIKGDGGFFADLDFERCRGCVRRSAQDVLDRVFDANAFFALGGFVVDLFIGLHDLFPVVVGIHYHVGLDGIDAVYDREVVIVLISARDRDDDRISACFVFICGGGKGVYNVTRQDARIGSGQRDEVFFKKALFVCRGDGDRFLGDLKRAIR